MAPVGPGHRLVVVGVVGLPHRAALRQPPGGDLIVQRPLRCPSRRAAWLVQPAKIDSVEMTGGEQNSARLRDLLHIVRGHGRSVATAVTLTPAASALGVVQPLLVKQ